MFNVIHDSWIKTDKGKFGIRELLDKAPELKEIRGDTPLAEFALYRFMFTFLMDAYQPQTYDDIMDILDEKAFDMTVIDDYIEQCESEGISFDIFDKDRPFMQEPESTFEKPKAQTIGKLNPLMPTGTSKRFFDKTYESQIEMSDDEIARFLVAPTVRVYDGNGYQNCISGAPVYAILKGKNLFETLIMGLIPIDSAGRPYSKPYWRMGSVAEMGRSKDDPVVEPGLLFALTLPTHRIHIIDNKSMHYEGKFYYNAPSWRDPYVPYFTNEKGETSFMKPRTEFYKRWTDLLTLCEDKAKNLKVVELNGKRIQADGDVMELIIYECPVSNSKYRDMRKGEFVIPENYSGAMIDHLKQMATLMDKASTALSDAVSKVFKNKSGGMKPYIMQHFHEECDKNFEKRIADKNFNHDSWIDELNKTAMTVFDNAVQGRLRTDEMVNALKAKAMMIGTIKKLKKEESNAGEKADTQQP